MSLGAMTLRQWSKPAVSAGLAIVAFVATAAWVLAADPVAGQPSADTTAIEAARLIKATTGDAAVKLEAVGDRAKIINAALPFSSGPVAAARPFHVSGETLDGNRAELCLAQAVYYEAGFEPVSGRRAVAQVVLNRVRHPAFPNSICGVVYQGAGSAVCQFTFVCDGSLYRKAEPKAWREARAIARAALSGYVERSVGEATHYHADYVAPRWAPLLAKVDQIGAHIFYRWPGAWGQPRAFTTKYIGEPSDPAALRPAGVPNAGRVETTQSLPLGPPVPRAANDVGGLLDTSKGWTLHIPDPRELRSASAHVLAEQKQSGSAGVETVASATPGVPAGR